MLDGTMGLSMSTLYSFLRGQAPCWGIAKVGGEDPVSLGWAPGNQLWKVFCTVLGYCVIVATCWMSFSPCGVWSHGEACWKRGKKKQSAASCILFVSCGPGLDDVCVCVFGDLALWTFHVCVFLVMLCSAKAGWHHQALERALGGTGSVEGLGDFVPVRASNLGLSWSVCSRCGWKKEEQQENSAIIFGPSFVRQVDNTASQSGSWSTKTHQVMIWAVQGPWLGDVHEVQWPWHYMTPETQTHHYQLVRLTVIFGPYLAWPSLCINDARDSVPSGLFFLPLLQWHFLSGETVWDSGFWYRPRR